MVSGMGLRMGVKMGLGVCLAWELALHMGVRLRVGGVISTVFLRFFRVRLGHHSLSPMYESGQQLFQGIKSIAHPGYSHPGHSNDLMLIKLNKRIRETPYVRPINIASCCPSAGTSCLVSGWGTTSSPQGEYLGLSRCPPMSAFSPSLSLSTLPLPCLPPSLTACPALRSLCSSYLPQSPPVPEHHGAE